MKIVGKAIIFTDVHIGRKQFSYERAISTLEYMKSQIKDSNINTVFILGDFFDNRKFIDWRIFNSVNSFFESIKDKNIIMVVGNHDIYFKNRIDENSISYLGKMFENIKIIERTEMVDFNQKDLLFVPWLIDSEDSNNPNKEQIKQAHMILGHFEFINFELLPGIVSSHGFSTENYKNKKVLSGHYHIMSEQNSIKYLGVCEQMSWSDFNSKKGYHVLNEDLTVDFIENTESEKFVKVWFDSSKKKPILVEGSEINSKLYFENSTDLLSSNIIQNNNVRVYLSDIKDKTSYNNFIIALDMNHIEYTVIDVTPEMNNNFSDVEPVSDDVDIKEIFSSLISNTDNGNIKVFNEIYSEAVQLNET